MPKISVIIPVYRVEAYLPRCVDSILAQSFSDFELILIDDGSPDGSGEICDKYARKDSRIKVIHQNNAGVSGARNRGIDVASGEYLVFVDSDDWVGPNYLSDLSKSEADLVIHSYSTIDEKGEFIRREERKSQALTVNKERVLGMLREGLLGYTVSKRFTMSIVKEYGVRFNEHLSHTEDTLFTVDYLQYALTVEIEDKDNYYYVRYNNRDSLSNGSSLDRLAMVCTANDIICKKFYSKNSEEFEGLFYSRIAYSFMSYVGHAWAEQNNGWFRKYLWIRNTMENLDVMKIMCYEPNALWKLPLNGRIVAAMQSRKRMRILFACLRDSLSGRRK